MDRACCAYRRLYEQRLSDLPHSIDAYEEVLSREYLQEALEALERLLGSLPEPRSAALPHRPDRRAIYRRADKWQQLCSIYEVELLFIDDKAAGASSCSKRSPSIQEQRKRSGRGVRALSRAWSETSEGEAREEPFYTARCCASPAPCRAGGARRHPRIRRWKTLTIASCRRVFARHRERSTTKLGDRERSIEAWRKVTSVQTTSRRLRQKLERLLGLEQRHARLVVVLEKLFTLCHEAARRSGSCSTRRSCTSRCSVSPSAIATWRQVPLDERDGTRWRRSAAVQRSVRPIRTCTGLPPSRSSCRQQIERRPLRFAMAGL